MNAIELLEALMIDVINWLYPLLVIMLASVLEGWLIFSVSPEISPLVMVAIFPILYLGWLFLFIGLNILSISILFFFGKKPRLHNLDTLPLIIQFSPITLSYRLMLLITTLPVVNFFLHTPHLLQWITKLVMRAYSPEVHIGRYSLIFAWLQDPDLTYIGDGVIIGSECTIVAHALNTSIGRMKYVSEPIIIGNHSTIGGNTRIGMGVKIDEGAIVEVGSNVLPYTRIGRGEVWGGNPAIFRSFRNEYPDDTEPKYSGKQIESYELNTIIARAIQLRPEEITPQLNGDNCMTWDSIAKMSIAASLYDRFNIRVPTDEIFKLDSCESIERIIAAQDSNSLPGSSQPESTTDELERVLLKNPELLPLYDPETVTQALARHFREPSEKADKKIVIAATFTAQPLRSALELWCLAFHIPFAVEFGEFNQVEQTLLSADSDFIHNQNGLNVVLTRPEDLISDLDSDGMIRSSQLLEAIESYAAGKKNLIVSNLPPVVSPFFHGKHLQVEKLRVWWQEQLEKVDGIHILDFASVVEEVGLKNARDASFDAIARAPYSPSVYQRLGIAITHLVRGICLPTKKVLALDCDGTLWGGRVGEDGIDGLVLSNDPPGRSFRLFQEKLLELKKRGVLLVLVSKNEEADVCQAIAQHPDMVLKREDIAAYRINWKEKSSNLRELASELNLGLDSFVFVDDSPVERLEVEMNAEMVTVVPMPSSPAEYVETLSLLWCFDSASITMEDTMRSQFMAHEQQRRESQSGAIDLQSYLESLQLVVEIRLAEAIDLPRVAQLTQKTNQFNLSSRCRGVGEIEEIHKSCFILVLNARDRFGDYGLVGVAILKPENGCLLVDTFLLSCRVLGRGVEEFFLCTIFDFAHQKNLKMILAPYRSGPRNGQVKSFLLKMGFSSTRSDILEAEVANAPEKPKHIKSKIVNVALPTNSAID